MILGVWEKTIQRLFSFILDLKRKPRDFIQKKEFNGVIGSLTSSCSNKLGKVRLRISFGSLTALANFLPIMGDLKGRI